MRGATEGINLVAQSWGAANFKDGDEIILVRDAVEKEIEKLIRGKNGKGTIKR